MVPMVSVIEGFYIVSYYPLLIIIIIIIIIDYRYTMSKSTALIFILFFAILFKLEKPVMIASTACTCSWVVCACVFMAVITHNY